ncbi:hypothetical protein HS048_00835 [Planomonospora sp. ID91781]|uniref:hypothetical protein n=1 Tax=Planomonospora sp. ID91781 TaxID=2738135 RepID=UPI0018C3CDAE|nr:hypothetical protein [Planomonospora sp. ID91781]MBG0819310.1 hypothetical protein [Planomonospora sp. ID91781]
MTWAYHSIHVAPPLASHEKLTWRAPLPRTDRVRIRQHTCMCRDQVYELCASGGLMFIRRTTKRAGRIIVHETERWLSKRAEEVWLLLLTGRVL